ncbi:MAG: beta-galactosidase [Lachnospiraceae bacterium]|nr:beta-galactosidase [Lachnospiraceae bacterium]
MIIGVDYYPEHWGKEFWIPDADLMRKTGVGIVRMAEFAWSRLSPKEGVYTFEWLDEIIGIFRERGIKVILGTPTNCPPRWFCEKYPDAIPVGRDARPNPIGIRGHRCYNHPDFLRHAGDMIERMTKRYAKEKTVVAWQIDNELEANFCFCKRCTEKYRAWLKEKYGDLESINKFYGNEVWSGEYSSWEQIDPPFGTYPAAWLNPAYMLDFNRFASDDMIQYVDFQAKIIRRNCPEAKITTNVWFCENMPDFYKTFAGLDFVSFDNYPPTKIPEDAGQFYSHAFHLDLMRGIKRQGFCVMEELSGEPGCWSPMGRMPYPGMISGYSLQAFAHGADAVVHFRWRTAVSGAEMYWHGLIDHSNVPGRRFKEFEELCRVARGLKDIAGTQILSEVAILYSADNEYAFKIQPQTNGMYYLGQIRLFYEALMKYGLNIDIIGEQEELSGYKLIVAPEMYVTDPEVVKKLYAFVKKGGTLVLTNRSGVKNKYNNCIMEPLPAPYRELVGCCVLEYDPVGYDHVAVRFADGSNYRAGQWCDILKPEGEETKVLACYNSEFYKGSAAITENKYGSGTAYYIGTVGEQEMYVHLLEKILQECGIAYIEGLPDHVEITTRTGKDITARFLFNNAGEVRQFILDGKEISLQPFEMRIERSDIK